MRGAQPLAESCYTWPNLHDATSYGPHPEGDYRAVEAVVFRPGMSLAQIERIVIGETLKDCSGNKVRAAAILGISVKTLYNRVNAYRELDA